MAELTDASAPLDARETARLTDFARACKAAARAVLLYPAGHPAIAATLGRIVSITGTPALTQPLKIRVLPDGLLLDDRTPARPDASLGELATLLHSHLIGEMTIHPGGDIDAWRTFLLLLGRSPESVRTDGGIARVWTTMAGRHVEVREIDYAEVLRERSGGDPVVWKHVIASCLQGSSFELDEAGVRELLGIAADSDQLANLMASLENSADGSGGSIGLKTAALMRMLRGIVDAVSKREPEQLEPVLKNMAAAVGRCSPEMMLGLLGHRGDDEGPPLMQAVVSRMSDVTISRFVSRHVISGDTSTDRLAQAFQTLVRDEGEQSRVLAMAKDDVAASPLGSTEGFESVWNSVAEKLLTSYSDEPFVSDAYGKELSGARTKAIEVEGVSDDPPDRIAAWLGTIATTALRALDLALMIDLLRIEQDEERWRELMKPLVGLVEDLLLVGDFDAAAELIAVLVGEAGGSGSTARRQIALTAIDVLVAGSMMRHVTTHLAGIDEAQFERVKAMCVMLGEVLVRPLAEALSVEERPRTRERLTIILLAFGSVGRRTIERLKNSQNPAVRRTAIHLMRQFSGSEALPDLTELLDDNESQVQREAVRAILNIGTDAAFRILEQALASGTTRSREAIMQSIGLVRDERATPLFAYIIGHIDHRGALAPVYLRAIESLGALRDPGGVGPLRDALYKGEWWAPRRTGALRAAAASALARIGTADAIAVLDEAVAHGPRGVRSAARAQLSNARLRRPARVSGDGEA
jgi:HEAT repeat protein/PBS lyase HEAT-like repeat-containing protein